MKLKQISCLMCMSFSLIVVGCGNQNSSSTSASSPSFTSPVSSTSPFDSSSTLSSSSSSSSSATTGKTISQLSDLILSTSMNLESDETESATRSIITVAQESFAIKTTATEETLVTYDAPIALTHGTEDITYKSTDEWLGDDYEGFKPRHREYDYFRGVYEGTYYEILDVEGGKEDDSAERYEIGKGPDQISQLQVNSRTTMTASYIANYYLTNYMATAISESTIFEPKVNGDESTYSIDGIDVQQDETGVTTTTATLEITFSSDGFLKEVRFNSLAYGFNWETNEYNDYVKNSEDTVIVANYSETLTSEIENDLNPGDYLTTSADLYLYDSSSYYEEELDISHVKVGTSIDVKARSFAPSTSLDTKFEIVSSSNTAVVDEKYDSWKAVGVGTTDLTIRTDLGYEQVITVTTYVPAVESISLGRIDELSVGETATLYINTTPNDAVGTFTVTTNVEGIVSISEGYTSTSFRITALKAGIVTITVTCNENTSLTAETSIEVKNKMTDEEITAALVNKTWTCYDYNNYCKIAVVFNSDGTGTVTEADLDPITFNWELVNGNVIVDTFEIYEATYENIRFTINSNVTTLKASQSDTSGWYQIDWTLRVE